MKTITINVTQGIIDAAFGRDVLHDIISMAIFQSILGAADPHVDPWTIRWTDERGIRHSYITPASVRDAIFTSDGGEKVEPFSFELRGGVTVPAGSC